MELEAGGNKYFIGKLDALTQFHVARRLGPMLAALGETLPEMVGAIQEMHQDPAASHKLLTSLTPILTAMSKLPDEDVDYVLKKCLSVVKRQQGSSGWASVQSSGGLMFDDIDMQMMLRLAVSVIVDNLGGFFPSAQASSTEMGQK